MKTILSYLAFRRNPNLQTWRVLRRVLVVRLPEGTFKARARRDRA